MIHVKTSEKQGLTWYAISALIIFLSVLAYLILNYFNLIPDGSYNAMVVSDGLNIVSTMAFLAFSVLAFFWSRNLKIGKGILAFTLSALFYVIAEVTWALYNFVLNVEIPSPSIADIFYILGAVTFAIALLLVIKSLSGKARLDPLIITVTIIGCAIIAGTLYLLTYGLSFDAANLSDLVGILYPVLDFISLAFVIKLLMVSRGKSVAQAQIILAAGVFITSISDIMFAFGTATGLYSNGSIADFLFAASYLLFAISVWRYVGLTKSDISEARLSRLKKEAIAR